MRAAWEFPRPRPPASWSNLSGPWKTDENWVGIGLPYATDLLGDLGQGSASLPASVSPFAVSDDPYRDFLGLRHLSWLSHLPHSASLSPL